MAKADDYKCEWCGEILTGEEIHNHDCGGTPLAHIPLADRVTALEAEVKRLASRKVCQVCEGRGERMILKPDKELGGYKQKFGKCPDCNGTGYIESEELKRLSDRYKKLADDHRVALTTINALRAENERLTAELTAERTAERERNRWIPVGERLPEYRERVEFFGGADMTIHIGYYVPELPQWTAEDGAYFHGKNILLITHWRPIVPPEVE